MSGFSRRLSYRGYWWLVAYDIGIARDVRDSGVAEEACHRLANLGANLAVAGALKASFNLGMTASKDLYWHGRAWWSPGCRKDAAPYLKESP